MNHSDKLKTWKARPYSWSAHNSFAWNKDQWFSSYILGERGEASAAMLYGNIVGESIGTDKPLSNVPRQSHMEYKVETKLGNIPLIGFFDSYDPEKKLLEEYKTSANDKRWTKETVNAHGQLTYYAMLLYLAEGVKPEELTIRLHWIPVKEGSDFSLATLDCFFTFPTKRTTKDVFRMMVEIKKRRAEMEAFAIERLQETVHKVFGGKQRWKNYRKMVVAK